MQYDISRDGQRFLMLRGAPVTAMPHWAEAIRRRMVEQAVGATHDSTHSPDSRMDNQAL